MSEDGEGDENEAAEQELGEATVRLVRLFANIAINSDIGFALARRKDTVNVRLHRLHVKCIVALTLWGIYSCTDAAGTAGVQ